MSASAIEAGKGFVRIFADLNPLDRGLKQLEAKMQSFGAGLSSVGSRVAGIGAGAAAIGASILAPIGAATKAFATFGAGVQDVADRTGARASFLSELGYAAEQSGSDLGTVEKGLGKLQKGITGAAGGSKSLNAAFDSIGLSATKLAALSPEQQFEEVAKAVGGIKDPTQRAAKAMEIFGKSGTQLLPLLTSDMEALRKEARELGVSISDVDAGNAADLDDAFLRIQRTIGGIGTQIGAAIAEPLTKSLNVVSGVISGITAWIKRNRELVQTVAAIGAGLVVAGGIVAGLGIAIVGVGAAISAMGAIIGGIVTTATAVFSALATAIGFILSPIGLVIAAVVGLGAYITYSALSATSSVTKLGEMFGSLGGTAVEAWGGIVAALSTGDLETAGQIAFTALEVGWLTITTTMRQVWANVSDFFVNVWRSAVEAIVHMGASIYFGISKAFDQIAVNLQGAFDVAITYIQGAFDTAFAYIAGTIDGIQTSIAKAIIKAQEFFGMFSKEESLQIQATLDGDLKQRADGRQKGLDSRANERQTGLDSRANARQGGLDQRDKQRQATSEQFSTIVSEDFKRAKTKVDNSGVSEAQKRLDELKLSLSTKASEAKAKAEEAQKDGPAKVEAAQQSLSMVKNESGGSTGTFVSGVSASIAGGGVSPLEDLSKQQLEALTSIDSRLREASSEDDE